MILQIVDMVVDDSTGMTPKHVILSVYGSVFTSGKRLVAQDPVPLRYGQRTKPGSRSSAEVGRLWMRQS